MPVVEGLGGSPGIEEPRNIVDLDFVKSLVKNNDTKIVLFVLDGLGGLPKEPSTRTELEAADTPHLDNLAAHSLCGLHQPIGPGITPGSGPSHLALFGYDPLKHQVGRGVLSALGIDFDLRPSDVAARGNFCTLDGNGRVTDRRAGRISTEKNQQLCSLLREIKPDGIQLFVETVKDYRLLLVLRGDGLSPEVTDTDPQAVGESPLEPLPLAPEAARTVHLIKEFLGSAKEILADHHPANMLLLRGFSRLPSWPSMQDLFGLRAAAIATYPMYRGVAKLVGMDVLETAAESKDESDVLQRHWADYDFFFVHFKPIDSAGEDGDFDRKVALIEQADAMIPQLLAMQPDVLIVTGDHSTPAVLRQHSWHPVPVLLWSRHCREDGVDRFGERACIHGGLGSRLPSVDLMPLALANALRLEKFGA
jgi:2,3-bisphosphoglycerate-independent phosphoglycerate mutase